MKTAMIILYAITIGLFVVVVMNYLAIQKLTPQAPAPPATPASTPNNEVSGRTGSFGDMVDAVKNGAKQLEIKATF